MPVDVLPSAVFELAGARVEEVVAQAFACELLARRERLGTALLAVPREARLAIEDPIAAVATLPVAFRVGKNAERDAAAQVESRECALDLERYHRDVQARRCPKARAGLLAAGSEFGEALVDVCLDCLRYMRHAQNSQLERRLVHRQVVDV